jgi:signal transduction histidine kinase
VIGDREAVRNLVKMWSGIALYRDGYRVVPYGDEGDDWLGLDRDALSAGGYKLNTKQIIGRVNIGRTSNPKLLDQTNRQGLVDSFEKQAMVAMLNTVISRWWRGHLNEANVANKALAATDFDAVTEKRDVNAFEERARRALKTMKDDYSVDETVLQQVREAFQEVKEAHSRAVARIETIEDEKIRLTQLAGIGLMIEVIAHELTRATEATQEALKGIRVKELDETSASSLKVLGQQVKVIKHRLQVLEPLSIPGRQRRTQVNLHSVADYVLISHEEQFRRHGIHVSFRSKDKNVSAFAIEGHLVQILENLISNSVYWLKLQKDEHPRFKPEIDVSIRASPPRIRVMDNGPGIPTQRAQSVFEPFMSTKSGTTNRRRGLGLYIARQNAEQLEGTLELIEQDIVHVNRFNTFELTLLASAS